LEDVSAEREIELGGQTTTTTSGMKLGYNKCLALHGVLCPPPLIRLFKKLFLYLK
jgi:hypothetical protein